LETGYQDIREAVQFLEQQADRLRTQQPKAEARVRLHYEAAWGYRTLAEAEVAAARQKMEADQWQRLKDEAIKRTPTGQTPPAVPVPEIPLKQVPLQPSEERARAQFQAAFTALPEQPDLPLAWEARFALAELLAQREEFEPAVKLLKEAMDKELP